MVSNRKSLNGKKQRNNTIAPETSVYCFCGGVPVIAKVGLATKNGSSFSIPLEKKSTNDHRPVPETVPFEQLKFDSFKKREKLKRSLRESLC